MITLLQYIESLMVGAVSGFLFWVIITEIPSGNLVLASIAFGGIVLNILFGLSEILSMNQGK